MPIPGMISTAGLGDIKCIEQSTLGLTDKTPPRLGHEVRHPPDLINSQIPTP